MARRQKRRQNPPEKDRVDQIDSEPAFYIKGVNPFILEALMACILFLGTVLLLLITGGWNLVGSDWLYTATIAAWAAALFFVTLIWKEHG